MATQTVQGTATKAKLERVNMITGIKPARVKRALLDAAAQALNIEGAADMSDEALAVAIHCHYDTTLANADKIRCLNCRGISPEALDACPYCGDDNGEEVNAEHVPASASPTEPAPAPVDSAPAIADKKEPAAAKPAKKAKQPAAETKEAQMTQATEHKNGKTNGHASTALAKAATSTALTTSKDLDNAVTNVQRLKAAAAVNYWHLGHAIKDIYDRQLWKQREEDGKPRWKSFESFVAAELGMTHVHAFRVMDVATNYTEKQMAEYGVRKLGLLLEVPKEDRERLLEERVAKGASKAEIQREVTKIKQEKGHRRESRNPNRTSPAAASKARSEKSKAKLGPTITIASIVGTQTIALYKKPASMRGVVVEDLPPAKKLADAPFGRMELANGVVMLFSVIEAANGTLKLKVHTTRDEE